MAYTTPESADIPPQGSIATYQTSHWFPDGYGVCSA